MAHSGTRRRVSRLLHWIDDITSRSAAALVVTLALVAFAIVLSIAGFPGTWESAFSTIVGAITLIMLFVIQHTQSRHQTSLQLKLDELIRSSPDADDHFVHIEKAEDSELLAREQDQVAHHEAVREGESLEIVEFTRNPSE